MVLQSIKGKDLPDEYRPLAHMSEDMWAIIRSQYKNESVIRVMMPLCWFYYSNYPQKSVATQIPEVSG